MEAGGSYGQEDSYLILPLHRQKHLVKHHHDGRSPSVDQKANVAAEAAMTEKQKRPAMVSASRCTGASRACSHSTSQLVNYHFSIHSRADQMSNSDRQGSTQHQIQTFTFNFGDIHKTILPEELYLRRRNEPPDACQRAACSRAGRPHGYGRLKHHRTCCHLTSPVHTCHLSRLSAIHCLVCLVLHRAFPPRQMCPLFSAFAEQTHRAPSLLDRDDSRMGVT